MTEADTERRITMYTVLAIYIHVTQSNPLLTFGGMTFIALASIWPTINKRVFR